MEQAGKEEERGRTEGARSKEQGFPVSSSPDFPVLSDLSIASLLQFPPHARFSSAVFTSFSLGFQQYSGSDECRYDRLVHVVPRCIGVEYHLRRLIQIGLFNNNSKVLDRFPGSFQVKIHPFYQPDEMHTTTSSTSCVVSQLNPCWAVDKVDHVSSKNKIPGVSFVAYTSCRRHE